MIAHPKGLIPEARSAGDLQILAHLMQFLRIRVAERDACLDVAVLDRAGDQAPRAATLTTGQPCAAHRTTVSDRYSRPNGTVRSTAARVRLRDHHRSLRSILR
jgi:hypothetical protein